MESTYSSLQTQFPLSFKKKFSKKFIQNIPSLIIYPTLVVIAIVSLMSLINPDGINESLFLKLGLVFILLIVVIWLLIRWYLRVYIRTYYYSADDNFLTIKKGAITPSEIHIQYQKIQDVYVDQDILDRLFGLYDVHIASATASSGIEAHIDGVEKNVAEGLKKFLLDSIKLGNNATIETNSQIPLNNSYAQPVFKSTEELSSAIYPLSKKWFWVTLITRTILSIIIGTFVIFYIIASSNVGDGWVILLLTFYYLGVIIWRPVSLSLWRKNYSFKFSENYIYYRQGILSLSEKHMPYNSIQDATISQGFIERIFGLAEVNISDASQVAPIQRRVGFSIFSNSSNYGTGQSGITLQGLSLSDANKISDLIKSEILNKKQQINSNGL